MPRSTVNRPLGRLWPLVILLAALAALTLTGPAGAQTATTAGGSAGAAAPSAETTEAAAPGGAGLVVAAPPEAEPLNPGLAFESVAVQVWPEYDTPGGQVLVMTDIVLPQDVQFPVNFKFAVPKGAQVTGVAEVRADGSFDYSRPAPQFDTTPPDRDIVSVQIPKSRNVRLEYYYTPGMNLEGQRDFGFNFELPADAQQVSLSVQQPARASGFTVTPALSQSSSDQGGFSYVGETVSEVKGGDSLQTQISYSKSDANPSVDPGSAGTPGAGTSTNWLLILLVVLVVGVGGFAGYRLLKPKPATYSRGGARKPQAARSAAARPAKGGSGAGTGGARKAAEAAQRFCTNCGAEMTKRDRFCPECGTARGA
jgi:hypothetical protein